VLSLQLPFALWPLIRFTSDPQLMGPFVNSRLVKTAAWGLFGLISAANLTLLWFWIS
jgi:manganese transport protein